MATKKKNRRSAAKKLRKDEARQRRLQSVAHISQTALAVKNRLRKQSRRWLRQQLGRSDRSGISHNVEHEIYLYLKSSKTGDLGLEAHQVLSVLDTERAGAREAAGVGEMEWVGDWFDGGEESKGPELEAGCEKGEKDTVEAESDGYEEEGWGSVMLSPVLRAEVEMGKISGCEEWEGEEQSLKL